MNFPLITIAIPIYNCEQQIEKCLHSVIAQSYQNIEILLIDDMGTDNSIAVVESFMQHYPNSSYRLLKNNENRGLSVVRNIGIDNAKGKYIFFLDSDDEITPDCIEKMVDVAEKETVQMVCGNVRTIKLESNIETDAFKLQNQKIKLTDNSEIFESYIKGKFPVPSWNKLILLDFLKSHKLYFKEGIFAQDSLQSFETALVLDSVYFLKDYTYVYYLHKDSVIHNRKKRHFDNWITIAKKFEGYYQTEKSLTRKKLILEHLIEYKTLTLLMNWKAQHNEDLWKCSYNAYKKLASFALADYFNPDYSFASKKENFLQNLPTNLGYLIFRKRFGK